MSLVFRTSFPGFLEHCERVVGRNMCCPNWGRLVGAKRGVVGGRRVGGYGRLRRRERWVCSGSKIARRDWVGRWCGGELVCLRMRGVVRSCPFLCGRCLGLLHRDWRFPDRSGRLRGRVSPSVLPWLPREVLQFRQRQAIGPLPLLGQIGGKRQNAHLTNSQLKPAFPLGTPVPYSHPSPLPSNGTAMAHQGVGP